MSPTDISPDAEPEKVIEQALFEVKQVVVGQDAMIERLMVCAIAGGHCLLEGPPGLAKTLAAKTHRYRPRRRLRPHPVHP